jgi:hypothetical protein
MILVVFTLLLPGNALAENSLEMQVVDSLAEECAKGEIKVGILDFSISILGEGTIPSEEIEKIKMQATESFEAAIFKEVKKRGLREKIFLVERKGLLDILNEQKLSTTGLTEKTAASIGGIAGIDIIIFGSFRMTNTENNAIAKLVRVKDARVLDIATQSIKQKQKEEPQALLNESFKVAAGNYADYGWNFPANENTLYIAIKSNLAVDLYILDDVNFKKYQAGQSASTLSNNSQITSKEFNLSLHKAGLYHVVVSNAKHLLMGAHVTLAVARYPVEE